MSAGTGIYYLGYADSIKSPYIVCAGRQHVGGRSRLPLIRGDNAGGYAGASPVDADGLVSHGGDAGLPARTALGRHSRHQVRWGGAVVNSPTATSGMGGECAGWIVKMTTTAGTVIAVKPRFRRSRVWMLQRVIYAGTFGKSLFPALRTARWCR